MKTCIMLENYVVYDGGKKIPWDVIWETIRQLDGGKVVERLQDRKKRLLRFADIERNHDHYDLKEDMRILGVRDFPTETLEQTRKRVLKRINHLEKLK